MAPLTKKLRDFAANVWLAGAGAIASILGFGWFIYDKFSPAASSDLIQLIILLAILMVITGSGYYSVRVRLENIALKRATEILHKINHDYRDILSQTFGGKTPISEMRIRIEHERNTLQGVCQSAAKIFNSLAHSNCMVTVKLIKRDDEGKLTCGTYARSEYNSERDRRPTDYTIRTGQNTAFDDAIQFTEGRISHFHSPDLVELAKDGKYQNQRPNWQNYYKSAIVVPIRYIDQRRVGATDASDDIGFLSVDTKSTNRLNDGYHLNLLAALADQMYNFMSLMRGKYRPPPPT